MQNKYYVYAHTIPTTKEIFYIGKGSGNRAYRKNRNKHWNNIVNKHGGFGIVILFNCLTEEDAFRIEKSLISGFKKDGLCKANYSFGGEGCSGYKWTEAQRLKHSKLQKSITKGRDIQASKLRGRTKNTHPGLKTISDKNKGCNNGRAIYRIITDEISFDTIKDAARFYNLSTAAVHKRIKSPNFNWHKELK